MDIQQKADGKTEIVRQDYFYSVIADILEMMRGRFLIISSDKKLHRLYSAVLNYVKSKLPVIVGEVSDFDIFMTVKK